MKQDQNPRPNRISWRQKRSQLTEPGNMDALDYACSATPEKNCQDSINVEGAPGNSAHGVYF